MMEENILIIENNRFKGMKSIVMECDALRLEVLPKGGRIVSIINKKNCREFLVQQKVIYIAPELMTAIW